jgi:DNA relaxase NicK
MLEVKGERSPEVVERLRSAFPHRATRMDSCADFDAPGAFERLLGTCMAIKRRHRLKGKRDGDWEDFPELGRTQYLGTPQSVSMLRLYEKGKQPEYRHLERSEWVRAEIQVRPAKEAKTEFSMLSAVDVWGASAWSRDLAGEILREHVDPHPAGTVWKKTGLERRLGFLCQQYGPTLLELHELLGSWECVGLTLSEKIKEGREH